MGFKRSQFLVVLALVAAVAIIGLLALGRGAGLDGTAWTLTAWSASSIDPGGHVVTLEFADGRIGGQAPVNSYGGEYAARGDGSFETDEIVSTLMAGDEDAVAAEALFFSLLEQVDRYRVDGDVLTLLDGAGEVLVFERVQ